MNGKVNRAVCPALFTVLDPYSESFIAFSGTDNFASPWREERIQKVAPGPLRMFKFLGTTTTVLPVTDPAGV